MRGKDTRIGGETDRGEARGSGKGERQEGLRWEIYRSNRKNKAKKGQGRQEEKKGTSHLLSPEGRGGRKVNRPKEVERADRR